MHFGLCATGVSHTVCISDEGIVRSMGQNEKGQLGLGLPPCKIAISNSINDFPNISMVSCGANFTFFVNKEGNVWSFGENGYGQLGTGNNTVYNSPRKIDNIPPIEIVSCGYGHTLIVTKDSNLWSCGKNDKGQLCLGNSGPNIKKPQQTKFNNISTIFAGVHHSIFQKENGKVYGVGGNEYGQLGLGHFNDPIVQPCLIKQESKIIAFCANNHSLFLDVTGKVFSVGKNDFGQLGLGYNSEENGKNENELKEILGIPLIRSISCSNDSSYLLDMDGKVWSFGRNDLGQLGHGDRNSQKSPKKIASINFFIKQISGGSHGYHFLAQASKDIIFVMGNNSSGQLGLEISKENNLILTPKRLPNRSLWKYISSFCKDDYLFLKMLIKQASSGPTCSSFHEPFTRLGQGCNGLVMKCELPWEVEGDTKIFTVALKMVINYGYISTSNHVNNTKNEFEILSTLPQHDNISLMLGSFSDKPTDSMMSHVDVSIKEFCFRDGSRVLKGAQFFILPFYEKTLQTVIEIENPSKERRFKYVVQISRALRFLKKKKIAHLDMKLNNIMLCEDDIVVVDFGTAANLDSNYNTKAQHDVGNIPHLAPEVLDARRKNDKLCCVGQYSWELGVLLFEIFSGGILPWGGSEPTAEELFLDIIPEEFHDLVKNLLWIDVNHRLEFDVACTTLEDMFEEYN